MRVRAAALAGLLALAGCAVGDGGSAGDSATPSPVVSNPPLDTVRIRAGERVIEAEVADEQRERILGLMHRTGLAPDAGMLFVFPAKTSGGFWMKNTLIPLSIAYLSAEGDGRYEVLTIVDMDPCAADPCPNYPPGRPYDAALEMEQGWFAEAGVAEGDVLELEEAVTAGA